MMHICLIALAFASAALAETTVGLEGTGDPMTTSAPITEFALILSHVKSTTSSVEFKWDAEVPEWMKVKQYQVTAEKKNSEIDSKMVYAPVESYIEFFAADDLIKDSEWEVCVVSTVVNGTEANAEVVEYSDCFDSFTIPYVRADSVYVCFIVIGYFVAMVLLGYICWKCAVNKQAREMAEAEEEDEGKKGN